MDLQITAKHLEMNDEMKLLVMEKVGLPLDKLLIDFAPDLKQANLRIESGQRWGYVVNLDMVLPGKKAIYAKAQHTELVFALVALREEVEKQLKKYKDRLNRSKRTK